MQKYTCSHTELHVQTLIIAYLEYYRCRCGQEFTLGENTINTWRWRTLFLHKPQQKHGYWLTLIVIPISSQTIYSIKQDGTQSKPPSKLSLIKSCCHSVLLQVLLNSWLLKCMKNVTMSRSMSMHLGMCMLEMVTLEYPYMECQNAAQIYKRVTQV